MSKTKKKMSEQDYQQVLQGVYNEENKTLGVDSFVVGKIGHKVERTLGTTNVANDTEIFTFTDDTTQLYVINVVYTDDTLETLISVERTA